MPLPLHPPTAFLPRGVTPIGCSVTPPMGASEGAACTSQESSMELSSPLPPLGSEMERFWEQGVWLLGGRLYLSSPPCPRCDQRLLQLWPSIPTQFCLLPQPDVSPALLDLAHSSDKRRKVLVFLLLHWLHASSCTVGVPFTAAGSTDVANFNVWSHGTLRRR